MKAPGCIARGFGLLMAWSWIVIVLLSSNAGTVLIGFERSFHRFASCHLVDPMQMGIQYDQTSLSLRHFLFMPSLQKKNDWPAEPSREMKGKSAATFQGVCLYHSLTETSSVSSPWHAVNNYQHFFQIRKHSNITWEWIKFIVGCGPFCALTLSHVHLSISKKMRWIHKTTRVVWAPGPGTTFFDVSSFQDSAKMGVLMDHFSVGMNGDMIFTILFFSLDSVVYCYMIITFQERG